MEWTQVELRPAADHAEEGGNPPDPRVVESLRAALAVIAHQREAGADKTNKTAEPRKRRGGVTVFWELLTAALLSVAFLVAMTLYSQLTGDIGTLNTGLNALREHANDYVRKEDYNSRNLAIVATIKEAQANSKESLALYKERVQGQERQLKEVQARLEQQVKDLERELLRLRERLAAVESRDKANEEAPKGTRDGKR
jgi:DNA repair exonuclease SbcCD ATPase subunit